MGRIWRWLLGETPAEHFARCPQERLWVDPEGRLHSNPAHIMEAFKRDARKWRSLKTTTPSTSRGSPRRGA